MGVTIDAVDPGDTLVNGRDPQTARDLLAAAEALGYDVNVVRAVQGGFLVPDPVWDVVAAQYAAAAGGEV